MDQHELQEFLDLRDRLHAALNKVSEDCPGKSYEGEMSLGIYFPGIYASKNETAEAVIEAHFYLIGPHRHYTWKGRTVREAVKKASRDIDKWIKECGM